MNIQDAVCQNAVSNGRTSSPAPLQRDTQQHLREEGGGIGIQLIAWLGEKQRGEFPKISDGTTRFLRFQQTWSRRFQVQDVAFSVTVIQTSSVLVAC